MPTEDDLTFYTDGKRHLVCLPYSVENLHRMAELLDIKRCWFHAGAHPHYDIPKKHIVGVKSRCIHVSSRDILLIIKGKMKKVEKSCEKGLADPTSSAK